jgi:hypothetical protein
MRSLFFASLLALAIGGVASAEHHFANITAVDVEKGTVVYTIRAGKGLNTEVEAPIAKNCVVKEGLYRQGKPAVTKEGDDIVNGLKNPVFQHATDKNPL